MMTKHKPDAPSPPAPHTPGPWTIAYDYGPATGQQRPHSVRALALGESDQMGDYLGCIVCDFAAAHGGRQHAYAECAANAHLIAAAPDLLAVCKQIVAGPHDAEAIAAMLPEISAAIAKAKPPVSS